MNWKTPTRPLIYKGVVFNEMKGAYSSPDAILGKYSQQSLFPDNTYGVDSGGDPRQIPDLTHEQLVAFHHAYYHPSNSRIFFYGDDPVEERLRILDGYLREFERRRRRLPGPLAAAFPGARSRCRRFMRVMPTVTTRRRRWSQSTGC